jgi:Tfp pilus assembly protein PilX
MIRPMRQKGMTLVVALVMLVVLTLLVVSAIRFGNINLRIAGNAQSETEATAAAHVAVETMVKTIDAAPNISALASETMNISTGGGTYAVVVSKPACQFNKPINNADLDPGKSGDLACFESTDTEKLVTSKDALTTAPTACKDQQWDVQANVDDTAMMKSGAKVSMLQGISVRVGAEVACP